MYLIGLLNLLVHGGCLSYKSTFHLMTGVLFKRRPYQIQVQMQSYVHTCTCAFQLARLFCRALFAYIWICPVPDTNNTTTNVNRKTELIKISVDNIEL